MDSRSPHAAEVEADQPSDRGSDSYDEAVHLVNENPYGIPVPVAYHSFGGWKASLLYTRGKVVTSRRPDPATSKVDLGFPQTR
jgi:malonate-semialdehyde dehydrogenase (acetylating) / methylmalonate-semialdehyde dehydrogenase